MSTAMSEVLELMKTTARIAGKIALERRKNFSASQVHTKATPADLVTDVDRELEKFIIAKLKAATPDSGFYGEEYGKGGSSFVRINLATQRARVLDGLMRLFTFCREL